MRYVNCKECGADRPAGANCGCCGYRPGAKSEEYVRGWNAALRAAIKAIAVSNPYAHGSKNCARNIRALRRVAR